jgi:hypothetical protein
MCSKNTSTDVSLIENPTCRYALQDVISDLTIEERQSVIGYIRGIEGVLQSSPFPHVEIDTSYSDIIIYDSALGWQKNNIEISTVAVRCVFNQSVAINTDILTSVFEPEGIDVSVSSDGCSTVIKAELVLRDEMLAIDFVNAMHVLLRCFDRVHYLSTHEVN